MEFAIRPSWPVTAAEAIEIQREGSLLVDSIDRNAGPVRSVAGVDVAYASGSDLVAAAAVVLDRETLEVHEESAAVRTADFPYHPGLFAFRELPAVTAALAGLRSEVDLLVCDGHGLAHPRRFGLACHLGVLTGLPAIGVAKTVFVGEYRTPGPHRGEWSPLRLDGDTVGCVLRTRDDVRPVFVSVGHRLSLETARMHTLALCTRYRLPETTRAADRLSRRTLRESAERH